jgi:hypothetical protein
MGLGITLVLVLGLDVGFFSTILIHILVLGYMVEYLVGIVSTADTLPNLRSMI